MESYVILAAGWIGFFVFHSILASEKLKSIFNHSKNYRLGYNLFSLLGMVALLGYMMLIPAEWVLPKNTYTKFFGLVLATYGILIFRKVSKQYNWKQFFGFEAEEKDKSLKTEGILAYVRHPLYLSLILLLTGYFFFSPSISNLVAWACVMLYLPFGIASEEKKLVHKFGKAYEKYQQEVPMLIPKKNVFRRGQH